MTVSETPIERALRALPAALLERLEPLCPGDRWERVLASFAEPPAVHARANPLAGAVEETWDELRAGGLAGAETEVPGALRFEAEQRAALLESAAWSTGRLFLQGLGSQLAAHALAPEPGERVLDLCAAPGAKTSLLWALMEGRGELIANDQSRGRAYKLEALLDQLKADGVQVRCRAGESYGRTDPAGFDRVMCDVPCSAEARLHVDAPKLIAEYRPGEAKRLAPRQERLLASAVRAVRPGGVVLYATCTLNRTENERVVERILKRSRAGKLPPVELEPLPSRPTAATPGVDEHGAPLPDLAEFARLWPDARTEGFCLARLRRLDEPNSNTRP
ncbi:MAG: RsmB/NOP family class I SAM-dependent RNA methyltransferase [Planctomycetota bacterium]